MAEATPSITFTADRTVIQPGEPVTFRWQVEGVKEVYFFAEGEDWRGHGVAGMAERQVRPAQTTAYHLRVVRVDGGVELRGIEIRVQEQARPPLAHSFSVDKTETQPGEPVTFRWQVEGVKEVYFFAEGEGWRGHGVAGVAERQVRPAQTTTYCLRVVRVDGSVEEHGIEVRVWAGRPAFAVDRQRIRPGEPATFRWRVEGVKAVYFHAENQPWREHGVAGVAEQQVCPDATTTYCLRVVKADDSLEVHYITVTVAP
jgi:hypothetical protein